MSIPTSTFSRPATELRVVSFERAHFKGVHRAIPVSPMFGAFELQGLKVSKISDFFGLSGDPQETPCSSCNDPPTITGPSALDSRDSYLQTFLSSLFCPTSRFRDIGRRIPDTGRIRRSCWNLITPPRNGARAPNLVGRVYVWSSSFADFVWPSSFQSSFRARGS